MRTHFILAKFLSCHHEEGWVAIGLTGLQSDDQVYLATVFNLRPNMKAGNDLETKPEGGVLKEDCNEEAISQNCKDCAFQPGMCSFIYLGL